jgi:hypothetical protein
MSEGDIMRTSKLFESLAAIALVAVLAVVASACGGGDGAASVDSRRTRPEILYLGSRSAITAVAPKTGRVRFEEASAVPSRDWSVLYSATIDGSETTLRTLDPATGAELARRTLPGAFTVRTVSEDGAMVALTPPEVGDTYHPGGKDPTRIVVVHRDDPQPQVLDIPGNVEPEAFSTSGDALFVIDFVPPLAPERYRVARLDLARGSVDDVRSKERELQEPMRGSARAQVMAPDGRRLYTLYTRDATADAPAEAFVHVLDLDAETATCVDLPPGFATSPLGALAVSPSGTHLYVVSPANQTVADLDTTKLEVARTMAFPLPPTGIGASARATATESTLYVAIDDQLAAFPVEHLEPGDWVAAPGVVTGIQPSTDGTALYVSLSDRVLVTDPRTLVARREVVVPSTAAAPVDHLAPALPPITPDGYTKCAC